MTIKIVSTKIPKVEVKNLTQHIPESVYSRPEVLEMTLERILDIHDVPEEAETRWEQIRPTVRAYFWTWYETEIK